MYDLARVEGALKPTRWTRRTEAGMRIGREPFVKRGRVRVS